MTDYAVEMKRRDYMYVLRRTVPPWRWEESLREIVGCCREFHIDEVCIKIDTGTFTHAFPDEKWLTDYQQILFAIHQELSRNNIAYSLNPNVLQGHGDRARMIDKLHPDWAMITSPDGVSSHDCACMQSANWQDYMRMQWRIYAETKPRAIWIEDDFRTFGHGLVGVGCFCREHMRLFNAKYGTNYSAKELHEKICTPCEVAPERAMWLDFQSERQSAMVSFLADIVHQASSDTVVGIMHSHCVTHTNEGRDWQDFARRASDNFRTPVLLRTPLGNYSEGNLCGLQYTAQAIMLSRAVLGRDYLDAGEIENFPYSTWSKSNLFTRLQIISAIAGGDNSVTLNLFDHCGMPMREENPEILAMLRDAKPFLSGLKDVCGKVKNMRGIRLYFNPRAGYGKKLPAGSNSNMLTSDSNSWSALVGAGLAATYEASPVTALAGQDIRMAAHDEIISLLSGGVLCDAVAFTALEEMGYGEYLGARTIAKHHVCEDLPTSGEHFFNPDFGGESRHYFALAPNTDMPLLLELEKVSDAIEITEIVDPDTRRLFGGAYVYTNKLGGRVAVYPFDVEQMGFYGGSMINFGRKKLFAALADYLFAGQVPMLVSGVKPLLPFCGDCGDSLFAGVMNMSLDPVKDAEIVLHVDNATGEVRHLDEDGNWTAWSAWSLDGGKLRIKIDTLSFDKPQFFVCCR